MKKFIILTIILLGCLFVRGQQPFSTMTTYANTNIISGAAAKITGNVHNTMINYMLESMGCRDYDATRTYTQDKAVVIYNGALWRCKTTISSAEAWSSAKWQQLTDTLLTWSDDGTKLSAYSTRNVLVRGSFLLGGSATAPVGSIGIENNKPIYFLSTAPSATQVLNLNASNEVELYGSKFKIASTGDITIGGGYIRGASYLDFSSGGVTTGVIRLANTNAIVWRNAAGTGNVNGITVGGLDVMTLNNIVTITTAGVMGLGEHGILNIGKFIATSGIINLENEASIYFRNAANTGDLAALYTVSDSIYLTDKLFIETTNIHCEGKLVLNSVNVTSTLADYDTVDVTGVNIVYFGALVPDTVAFFDNAKANTIYTVITKNSNIVTFENGGAFRMDSTITLDQYQSAQFLYDGFHFYLLNHR